MQTQVYISLVGPQNSIVLYFFLCGLYKRDFKVHTDFSSKFPKYVENTNICGTLKFPENLC